MAAATKDIPAKGLCDDKRLFVSAQAAVTIRQ